MVFTSAVTGAGMDEVAALVQPDRTAVFLGASGVGKSTIINALLGREATRTGRTKVSGEGRHTTSHRELLAVPGGGAVIDMPGLRSVTPVLDDDVLRRVYEDIAEVAAVGGRQAPRGRGTPRSGGAYEGEDADAAGAHPRTRG